MRNRSADAPDIHGNRVVWQERRQSGSVIVLYDLEARDSTVLTEGHRDCSPSVWGDRVVWTRESGLDTWLMFMDLETGYESALVSVRVGTTAALSETTVVHDNGGDLYLMDLRSAEEQALVASPHRTELTRAHRLSPRANVRSLASEGTIKTCLESQLRQ
jgi:beta propeller repeat protein